MNLSAADLTAAFARNVWLIKQQTEGLTQDDSLRPLPGGGGNCLNWVLGHIAVSRDEILDLLDAPPVMAEQGARYVRNSDPLGEADAAGLSLPDLLAWLDRIQDALAATLAALDPAALDREIVVNERPATIGQRVFFRYFHESYHVGQTELFRQLAGHHDKII